MEFRTLGRTGISLSSIGFGCGSIGGLFVRGSRRVQRQAVEAAVEGGVNYFDTAEQYGDGASEENLGRVLHEVGETVHVGTKVRLARSDLEAPRAVVRARLELSLRRLHLDRVDVLTLHSRLGSGTDALSAKEVGGRVADALRGIVEAGLASAVGFTGLGSTEDILEVATCGQFDSFQCYFNVLNPSAAVTGCARTDAQDFAGVLPVAAAAGLGAFCVRVLAGGALAGRPEHHPLAHIPGSAMAKGGDYDTDLRRARALATRLSEFPVASLPELAIRYALSERHFSCVIVGFSDESDVRAALEWEASGPLPAASLGALRGLRKLDELEE